jgi:hypothetical protein
MRATAGGNSTAAHVCPSRGSRMPGTWEREEVDVMVRAVRWGQNGERVKVST